MGPKDKSAVADVAFVLDPVVGSGKTMAAVVSILKKWGVPKIHVVTVLGSRGGFDRIMKRFPDVTITAGIVDDTLSPDGVVLPGMGDAGDRLFGTGNHDHDDGVISSAPSSVTSVAVEAPVAVGDAIDAAVVDAVAD